MSDMMLLGVLRMPINDDDPVQLSQLIARARQAADRIEADAKEIERLHEQVQDMIDASGQQCGCGYDKPDDVCLGHWPEYKKMREEIERLTRERDLAVAHDRQPYPTAHAYEQVCKANEARRVEIERLQADREQGHADYCALMDRYDDQHNEIERLWEALQKFLDNSSVQTNYPDECEFAEAAIARKEDV